MSTQRCSDDYSYFDDNSRSPLSDSESYLTDTLSVVDLTEANEVNRPGESRQSTLAPAERDARLEARMNAGAEKANEKRDKEDADFTPRKAAGKRRVGSNSATAATKRQRRETQTVSSSGATEPCPRLIGKISKIWGRDMKAWPVFEFRPEAPRNLSGAQRMLQQYWGAWLIEQVLSLAETVRTNQHEHVREVLRGVIQKRMDTDGGEDFMTARDVMTTTENGSWSQPTLTDLSRSGYRVWQGKSSVTGDGESRDIPSSSRGQQ